jgi:predicted negative regulator of RcsB-dependent stress response
MGTFHDWIELAKALAGPNGVVIICVFIIGALLYVARLLFKLWQAANDQVVAAKDASIARYKEITDQLTDQFSTTVEVMEGQRALLERLVERRGAEAEAHRPSRPGRPLRRGGD